MQLRDLVDQFGANGFVLADGGNGCGFGESGQFVAWDDETAAEYGDVELSELDAPVTSEDGVECVYGSEWIEVGEGSNPYRYRILF